MTVADHFLGKVPPHDLAAERSVLGGCLLRPAKIDEVAEEVQAEDFYADAHGTLWRGMAWLRSKGRPVDLITLAELLRAHGHLDEVGGLPALSSLLDGVVTAALVVDHARIVRELARIRGGISVCLEGLDRGYGEHGEADDYLSHLAAAAERAAADRERSKLRPISETIGATMRELEALRKQASDIVGVPSGLPGLDRMLGGFQPGELAIVAARPSMGKSAFMLTCALNAAERGYPTLIYSLEMRRTALERRLLSMRALVDGQRFLTPRRLEDSDLGRIADTGPQLAALPIHIDDSEGVTLPLLRARGRRATGRLGIKIVFVDYLQMLREEQGRRSKREETRERAVAEMIGSLRDMARELEVAVVLLAQLNRKCEERKDRRPIEADIRETGAAEQDADAIVMLYRPSRYGEPGPDEVIVRKNRNGACGTVLASYQEQFVRWVETDLVTPPARDTEPMEEPFYVQHYQEAAEPQGDHDEPF